MNRAVRRAVLLAAWMLGALAIACIDASASFMAVAESPIQVAALELGSPAGVAGWSSDGCASVSIAWTRVEHADDYLVQVREEEGPWTDLQPSTGDVDTLVDAGGHAGQRVEYRVVARDSVSGWTGAPSSPSTSLPC